MSIEIGPDGTPIVKPATTGATTTTKTTVATTSEESSAESNAKADVLARLNSILEVYGGLESNIPFNHDYWKILNIYRGM